LTAHVHHEGETTRFEDAHLRGEVGEVRGTVMAKFRREIPVEGTLIWDVKSLEGLLNKLDLRLSFDNQVDATTIVKGHFDPLLLELSAEGKVFAGAEVASARAQGSITKTRTDIHFSLAQETRTRIAGQISTLNGVLNGRADIETSDLNAVTTIAPGVVATLDLSGEGTASVFVRGTTSAPEFEGTISSGPLSVAGVYLDRLQGAFVWTEESLEIPTAALNTRGGAAVLKGRFALDESLSNDWQLELTNIHRSSYRHCAAICVVSGRRRGGTLTGTVSAPIGGRRRHPCVSRVSPRVAANSLHALMSLLSEAPRTGACCWMRGIRRICAFM
jgi:hypothetical protein